MIKKRQKRKVWILIAGLVILLLLYLNLAYAYFFAYLGLHEVRPINQFYLLIPAQNPSIATKNSVVSFGDSLTWGVGSSSLKNTYPYQLALHLSQGNSIELYNFGIPGAKTKDLIEQQLPPANLVKADYITLCIGVNDAIGFISEVEFKLNYDQILTVLTANPHQKVIIINIPPLSGSPIMLEPYNRLVDLRINRFNSIVKNLVSERKEDYPNLAYIDLYGKTKKDFFEKRSYYSADLFHPSDQGYKLWSEIIYANSNL